MRAEWMMNISEEDDVHNALKRRFIRHIRNVVTEEDPLTLEFTDYGPWIKVSKKTLIQARVIGRISNYNLNVLEMSGAIPRK
jgi:hypothetical protein